MSQIVVVPHGKGGFKVSIDGKDVATFADGGQAAAHYALQVEELGRVKKVVIDFATTLHCLTPDQANDLDCGIVRSWANQLRSSAGI